MVFFFRETIGDADLVRNFFRIAGCICAWKYFTGYTGMWNILLYGALFENRLPAVFLCQMETNTPRKWQSYRSTWWRPSSASVFRIVRVKRSAFASVCTLAIVRWTWWLFLTVTNFNHANTSLHDVLSLQAWPASSAPKSQSIACK